MRLSLFQFFLFYVFSLSLSWAQSPQGSPPFPIEVELQGGFRTEWDKVSLKLISNNILNENEEKYVSQGMNIFLDENLNLSQKIWFVHTLADSDPGSSPSSRLRLQYSMAQRLSADYNFYLSNKNSNRNPALEEIVRAAENDVFNDGGICGGIHTILSQFAQAQGFIHTGTHSLAWNYTGKFRKDEGHILSHFQDPMTKKYYLQNYQILIDTDTKDFRQMLERSLALFSALSMNTYVESRTGAVHQFQDNRARWVLDKIEHFAHSDLIGLHGEIQLKNIEQNYGLGFGLKLGEVGVGQFFMSHSQFQAANGEHRFSQVGLAINLEHTFKFKEAVVDEIYLSAQNFLALSQYTNPKLIPQIQGGAKDWERTLLEWGLDITGKIKVGHFKLGATLYSRLDLLDYFNTHSDQTHQYLEFLAESETPIPWVNLEYNKRFQVVPKTLADDTKEKIASVFDYVGLVVDTRKLFPDAPVFIVNRSGIYFLDGLENFAGTALNNSLELVWHAWDKLEVSAKARLTLLTQNRFDDPIFGRSGDFTCELSLGAKCQITENIALSFSTGYRGENQSLYFLNPLNVRPDLTTGQDDFFIQAGLEWQWGRSHNLETERLYQREQRINQRENANLQNNSQIRELTLYWHSESSRAKEEGRIEVRKIVQNGRPVFQVSWWKLTDNSWRMIFQNTYATKKTLTNSLSNYLVNRRVYFQSEYSESSPQIIEEILGPLFVE